MKSQGQRLQPSPPTRGTAGASQLSSESPAFVPRQARGAVLQALSSSSTVRAPSPASRKCSRKSVSFLLPPRAAVASPDTEFQFDPSEFDFWRTFLGGLTLDAFASPATAQLSEFCSPVNDFFNYNLRGHRIWAFPPFALVHRALRCIDRAVRCDSQTAALLLVPVRPRAPWWNLRSRFICLHRYPAGSHVLRRVAGKVVGPLFPSRSPLELWWLPPGRAPRATHVSAIKRAQRNIVTNMTNSKVKVDITVDDLRRSAFGNVGPPPSSDTSALMNADPGRDSPLDYSLSWTAPGSRGRAQSWKPSPRTSRGG